MTPYYDHDGITIYHGDCREIMPELGTFDLLLTDPPYVLTATGGGIVRKRKYLAEIDGFTDGGFDLSILDNVANWMVFCSKSQLIELLNKAETWPRWMLVTWNKTNPTPLTNANYLPDTEYIVHAYCKGRLFGDYASKSRFFVFPAQQNNLHPNEKPITLMAKCVALGTQEGDVVCDPFCGSGSTLVAAKLEGRKAVGIELEERYCEIAAKRLAQGVLF